MAKRKSNSRTARWNDAAAKAEMAASDLRNALEELDGIRQEYEEWRDNLPENLQSSSLSEKLNEVADMDLLSGLDEVDNSVQEAVNMDLPMGFGRD